MLKKLNAIKNMSVNVERKKIKLISGGFMNDNPRDNTI